MSSIASSSRSVLRASVPRAIASCPAQCVRPSMVVGAAAAAARATRSTIAHPNYSRSFFSLTDISKLAGTLTGASPAGESEGEGERSGIESDGETQKFHARKILPYSQAQLYSLVSDVPSYSSFIPFCTSSRVLSGSPSGSVGGGAGASAGASAGAVAGDGAMNDKERGTRDWKPDDQPFDLDAELTVGFGGLEERYTSRVVGRPFESVTATAAKQSPLFKSLKTTWSFSPASPLSPHSSAATSPASSETARPPNSTQPASPDQGPTLLTVDLAFSFANPLHRIASQAVLPKVADKMVEAFEERCLQVWGKGKD